jgi:hypothetical protein
MRISKSFDASEYMAWLLLFAVILCLPFCSQAQQKTEPASETQEQFDTPKQAADALIKAAGDYDVPALLAIFGPNGEGLISSADPVQDKNRAIAFAEQAHEKMSIASTSKTSARAILSVGKGDWPFPVPIVETGGRWHFDDKAGFQEILFRRIGANELDAIQICRRYVDAQRAYAIEIHDNSGVNQYAQKIFSTPGKQDGLYWENPDGTPGGPISKPVARALEEGYSAREGTGYHGYYFKILKGQGPDAPLGQLDYMIEGIMIGGFALVAVPAEYRVTGVKTFLVDYNGIVYQKDLGPDSLNIVKDMELYNPDKTWNPTSDAWPLTASTL